MPRFAVLEHDSPRGLHWDFMIQRGPVLATWALSLPPNSVGAHPASALADHRVEYLDYEGPVSGGRGSVARWDRGEYRVKSEGESELVLLLRGDRLRGVATLVSPDAKASEWLFRFAAGQGFSVEPET